MFYFYTQDGATPLIIASGKGHSDVVNKLIRNGAGVNLARKVWRYMYHTPTLYNCRRFSHKVHRFLIVYACNTLRTAFIGYLFFRGFMLCH